MKRTLLIVIAVLVIVPITTYALWQNVPGLLLENHLIESAQAALLLFAASIHLFQSKRFAPGISIAFLYHQTLSIFCISLFVREVDIDRLGSHPAWSGIEMFLRASIVTLWLYHLVRLLKHLGPLLAQRHALLIRPGSLLVYGGILLYGASWFFDKEIFLAGEPARFFEETIQLQATLLFFLGAVRFSHRHDSPERRSGLGGDRAEPVTTS